MYVNKYHTQDLSRYSFLITGGAGFIGSNLVEYLLKYNAGKVRVLDNFSTGFYHNIEKFKQNQSFELIEGDIRDFSVCEQAVNGVDYVSHHAALGSVPRSVNNPLATNEVNVSGFLNILWAVKQNGNIKRTIYAASSSTYGDSAALPKVEDVIGKPLSPYAVTKYVNELYAGVFARSYGIETIGLRYFNIFGNRQSPQGEYAAVIPLFIKAVTEGTPASINGDGGQTRDFTYVENAIQANMNAFFVEDSNAVNQIYNIACGERTSLNQIWENINQIAGKNIVPLYKGVREGDIKHSLADITKSTLLLNYKPLFNVKQGLLLTMSSDL